MDEFEDTVDGLRYLMEQTAAGLIDEVQDVNACDHSMRLGIYGMEFSEIYMQGRWVRPKRPIKVTPLHSVVFQDGGVFIDGWAVR